MVLAADDAEGCKTAPTCDHRVFTTKKVIARTMVLWARPALFFTWVGHRGFRLRPQLPLPPPPGRRRPSAPGLDAPGLRRRCQGPTALRPGRRRLPAVWQFDGDEPTRQRWMLSRRSIVKPDDSPQFVPQHPLHAIVADLAVIAGCRWKRRACPA